MGVRRTVTVTALGAALVSGCGSQPEPLIGHEYAADPAELGRLTRG